MRKFVAFFLLMISLRGVGQDTVSAAITEVPAEVKKVDYIWIFSYHRLINANTVEILSPGILEFSVIHNFGDIGGKFGGFKNFFGLDNAMDVRIGFQYGLSKRFNLIAARAKGASQVHQQYELGLKYRMLQQANDSRHPISMTLFGNVVVAGGKPNVNPGQEDSYEDFSDRFSQALQLMIARKFGNISLQVSPTLVNRSFVLEGDEKTLFAVGGAFRLPVKGKFSVIFDYFHTFRSESSKDFFRARDLRFYDAVGVGIELLTAGHVFHMNFTNATEILPNRFVPRTVTSWGKGQFRWGFTISRDFDLLWKKKQRK